MLIDFKPLERPEKYMRELNPVYMHRKDRGGCGHNFSPGDPWIIEAYLAGDLVPAKIVDDLRAALEDLRAATARQDGHDKQEDSERRAVTA